MKEELIFYSDDFSDFIKNYQGHAAKMKASGEINFTFYLALNDSAIFEIAETLFGFPLEGTEDTEMIDECVMEYLNILTGPCKNQLSLWNEKLNYTFPKKVDLVDEFNAKSHKNHSFISFKSGESIISFLIIY